MNEYHIRIYNEKKVTYYNNWQKTRKNQIIEFIELVKVFF